MVCISLIWLEIFTILFQTDSIKENIVPTLTKKQKQLTINNFTRWIQWNLRPGVEKVIMRTLLLIWKNRLICGNI